MNKHIALPLAVTVMLGVAVAAVPAEELSSQEMQPSAEVSAPQPTPVAETPVLEAAPAADAAPAPEPAAPAVTKKKSFFARLFGGGKEKKPAEAVTVQESAAPAPAAAVAADEAPRKAPFLKRLFGYSEKTQGGDDVNPEAVYGYGSPDTFKTGALKNAKALYSTGDIDEASRCIDDFLLVDNGNPEALQLKARITALQARMETVRKDSADEYYRKGKRLFDDGSPLEALYWTKKSLAVIPDHKKALALYQAIHTTMPQCAIYMDAKDRAELDRAVAYFEKGSFSKSAEILRRLQNHHTEVRDFLAIATAHTIDEMNIDRAREYIVTAIDEMRSYRYESARDYLQRALAVDESNMAARTRLEQISMEMKAMDSRRTGM